MQCLVTHSCVADDLLLDGVYKNLYLYIIVHMPCHLCSIVLLCLLLLAIAQLNLDICHIPVAKVDTKIPVQHGQMPTSLKFPHNRASCIPNCILLHMVEHSWLRNAIVCFFQYTELSFKNLVNAIQPQNIVITATLWKNEFYF